ncbi:MFS multidrug transporter [Histoplasma ohiense]|nr:MFS multidrug transporter [Histoplasma ohiense (nom. inval.)]
MEKLSPHCNQLNGATALNKSELLLTTMAADSDHILIDDETDALLGTESPLPTVRPRKTREKPLVFVFLCVLIVFCIDFGNFLSVAPQTRIYEAIACRKYYEKHEPGQYRLLEDIPEDKCKIPPVQGELAFVQGLQISFEALPSILLSIPYGRLADNVKYGRKFVLSLAVVGLLLNQFWVLLVCWFSRVMSLRAVWLGSAALFIGGGAGVALAMLMTMMTDVVEARYRSTAFFQIALAIVITQFLAPLLASWMMLKGSPWDPLFLGSICATCSLPLLLIIPETVHFRDLKSHLQPTSEDEYASGEDVEDLFDTIHNSFSKPTLKHRLHLLRTATKSVIPNRTTALILWILFIANIGSKQLSIMLLYVSTRYGIPLSTANFSLTIFAGVNIFLLLVLLPTVSRYLTVNRRYTTATKDLILSRFSIIMYTLGALCLGLAPTIATMIAGLVIYTLGSGLGSLNASMVATYVEPKHMARLYSVVSVVSMFGVFVGSPLLAGLFSLGLKMGKGWIGLPYFGITLLYGLIFVVVWFIRLPEKVNEADDGNRDSEDDRYDVETPSSSLILRSSNN